MAEFAELTGVDQLISFNGQHIPSHQPILPAANRSFRYGEGLFETMKLAKGSILLADYHFDRLFAALKLLQINPTNQFTPEKITREILRLCQRNGHADLARVRLTVFRGGDDEINPAGDALQWLIESSPITGAPIEKGLRVDIYPDGIKSIDAFSNLKSANRLIYTMSELWAGERNLDACLILNSHGRICDATIDNVFCIRNRMVYTPPLSEGGIAGTMRRFLMNNLQQAGFLVQEKIMDSDFLRHADEIFLTNAIRGIRPVICNGDREYGSLLTMKIREGINRQLAISNKQNQ